MVCAKICILHTFLEEILYWLPVQHATAQIGEKIFVYIKWIVIMRRL